MIEIKISEKEMFVCRIQNKYSLIRDSISNCIYEYLFFISQVKKKFKIIGIHLKWKINIDRLKKLHNKLDIFSKVCNCNLVHLGDKKNFICQISKGKIQIIDIYKQTKKIVLNKSVTWVAINLRWLILNNGKTFNKINIWK